MTDVLRIALTHFTTAIRERVTLFWFLVFPVFLLVLLALIFGNIGDEGEIHFEIGLINRDAPGGAVDFAAIVEETFERLAEPGENDTEPLFTLHRPDAEDDLDTFVEDELSALRRGRRAAVLVIPSGFGATVLDAIVSGDAPSSELSVYMTDSNVASQMASEIVAQILAEVDREILVRGGRYDPAIAIASEEIWLGGTGDETPYIDFVLPGIILMGFFVNGLFGVPGAILFNRDRKVLRRYWVTPLSVPRYLAGFSIGHLALCALQFALLYILGRYALGARVSFATLPAALLLVLSAATFLAFGFLIASLARTANAGMAVANILNMPMMFLSGLFFPIAGLPLVLRLIVYANPVSYLAQGLRSTLGVEASVFSLPLIVGVPLGWIVLSTVIASTRLKWDVER